MIDSQFETTIPAKKEFSFQYRYLWLFHSILFYFFLKYSIFYDFRTKLNNILNAYRDNFAMVKFF